MTWLLYITPIIIVVVFLALLNHYLDKRDALERRKEEALSHSLAGDRRRVGVHVPAPLPKRVAPGNCLVVPADTTTCTDVYSTHTDKRAAECCDTAQSEARSAPSSERGEKKPTPQGPRIVPGMYCVTLSNSKLPQSTTVSMVPSGQMSVMLTEAIKTLTCWPNARLKVTPTFDLRLANLHGDRSTRLLISHTMRPRIVGVQF